MCSVEMKFLAVLFVSNTSLIVTAWQHFSMGKQDGDILYFENTLISMALKSKSWKEVSVLFFLNCHVLLLLQ